MKELNKKTNDEINDKINIARKNQFYGYGDALSSHHIGYGHKTNNNKQFQNKLNKLLK